MVVCTPITHHPWNPKKTEITWNTWLMPCGSEDLTGQTAMAISGCSTGISWLWRSWPFRWHLERPRDVLGIIQVGMDHTRPSKWGVNIHSLTDLRSAGADPTGRSETMNSLYKQFLKGRHFFGFWTLLNSGCMAYMGRLWVTLNIFFFPARVSLLHRATIIGHQDQQGHEDPWPKQPLSRETHFFGGVSVWH